MSILEVPSEQYHQDDITDTPTLSASIAHLLVSKSPAHARAAHPKLNPGYERKEEDKFSVGSAAHALFLEGRDAVQIIDAPDWRTASARAERDDARAAGKIPLLRDQAANVVEMVNAVHEQLNAHHADPPLFTAGKPEQTIIWEEDGVICRARPDWLRDDHRYLDDLKTTSKSAHHKAYERALYQVGGDIQIAMHLRGLMAVTGSLRMAEFRLCVVETTPPYALSVLTPAADMLELGQRKVEHALRLWRECLETGEWPAYSLDVEYLNAPEWELARWLEREAA